MKKNLETIAKKRKNDPKDGKTEQKVKDTKGFSVTPSKAKLKTSKTQAKPKMIAKKQTTDVPVVTMPKESKFTSTTTASSPIILRYSDKDLNEFKDIINKKIQQSLQEATYWQNLLKEENEGNVGYVEASSNGETRDKMNSYITAQTKLVDSLKLALVRIENKTYGICIVTGKLIDKNRLRLVPHTNHSVEAKLGIRKTVQA